MFYGRWRFAVDWSGLGTNSGTWKVHSFFKVWLYCYLGAQNPAVTLDARLFLTLSALSRECDTSLPLSTACFSPPNHQLPLAQRWPLSSSITSMPSLLPTVLHSAEKGSFSICRRDITPTRLLSQALVTVPTALRMRSRSVTWPVGPGPSSPPSPLLTLKLIPPHAGLYCFFLLERSSHPLPLSQSPFRSPF